MIQEIAERDMQETTNEFLNFGAAEMKKVDFHSSKKLIDVMEVDVKKIIVSYSSAYGKNK